MNEQQHYLLGLLLEIHDICIRNGIGYSLVGGTLIGAVRHGGFLPWDDDMDIYMTRSNWQRFEAACRREGLPENRALRTPSDPTYPNTFPRYVSTDTVCIHSNESLNDSFDGQMIDIFILDPIEDDEQTIRDYIHDFQLYTDLIQYGGVFGRRFGVPAQDFERLRRERDEKGEAWLRKRFEETMASYVKDDGGIWMLRWGGSHMTFKREVFESYKEVSFEGHMLLAATGINEYLTTQLGDEWYEVPVVSEQPAHDSASSLLISAKEAEGMCLVENRTAMKEKLLDRKAEMMRHAQRDYAVLDELAAPKSSLVIRDTMSRYNELSGELSKEFRPEDVPVYKAIYDHYIGWQFSRKIAGRRDWDGIHRLNNPLLAELPEDAHRRLLDYLLDTEQTYRAHRLVEICGLHRELDAFERDIRDTVHVLRRARESIQYGRPQAAYAATSKILERHPYNKSALKIAICALLAQDDARLSEARALAQTARSAYPQDGAYAAYLARIETAQRGDPSGIQKLYDFAVSRTRDGFVLHYIEEQASCSAETKATASLALTGAQLEPAGEAEAFDREVLTAYERLLHRVLTLCEQAGVRALANPLQTIRIAGGQSPAQDCADKNVLFMLGNDLSKLVTFIEANPQYLPEDFAMEYMGNNPAYRHQTVSFYNTKTTDFSSRANMRYLHDGMFITIHPLTPATRSLLIGAQRSSWRKSCPNWNRAQHDQNAKRNPERRLRRGRRLFVRTMESFSKKTQTYRIRVCEEIFDLSASLFENAQGVKFESGARIFIPADAQAYTRDAQALVDEREGEWPAPASLWGISPRIVGCEDTINSYCQAVQHRKKLRSQRRSERRTRREFIKLFAQQKEIIATEDARRRTALESQDMTGTRADGEGEGA